MPKIYQWQIFTRTLENNFQSRDLLTKEKMLDKHILLKFGWNLIFLLLLRCCKLIFSIWDSSLKNRLAILPKIKFLPACIWAGSKLLIQHLHFNNKKSFFNCVFRIISTIEKVQETVVSLLSLLFKFLSIFLVFLNKYWKTLAKLPSYIKLVFYYMQVLARESVYSNEKFPWKIWILI